MNFFVSGTGTDVGKTMVTAGLLRCLSRKGKGLAVKPVQTGCENREAGLVVAPDLELWNKAVRDCSPAPSLFCPVRLKAPCSPHLAADMEGISLNFEDLISSINEKRQGFDWMVVEGAGGLLVPLNLNHTMLDFAAALELPVLLVIDNHLGAINEALLSVLAVRHAGLPLAGVVMNNTSLPASELEKSIRRDNVKIIGERGRVKIIAEIPYLTDFSADDPASWKTCSRALSGFL
jgi:dethiobiotin synthase